MDCATEPDLRARTEGITPEAASIPTPHGVSGLPANGTRGGATVSRFLVALAAALATAEAKPHTAPVSTRERADKAECSAWNAGDAAGGSVSPAA